MPQDYKCSYFVQQPCKNCGEMPSFIKNGLCAPCTTHDPSTKTDWIDCYKGCIKHDPQARKKHRSQKYEKQRDKREAKFNSSLGFAHAPQLHQLARLQRMSPENRPSTLVYHLLPAMKDRGIDGSKLSEITGWKTEQTEAWANGKDMANIPFIVVALVIEYMKDYDKRQVEAAK